MHFVTEPLIKGDIVKTEVSDHIEIYNGDYLSAKNVFNTSSLFMKILKPENYLIRKIGGEGYEYWVDGSKPKNYPVPDSEKKRIEEQMGGKWQETGTWRIEIMPQDKKDAYDFINVFYLGDANDYLDPKNVWLKEDAANYTIEIADRQVPTKIVFAKTDRPEGNITIKDTDGNILISDKFPEVRQ